ncbi:hypothetical protein SGLAM104S_00298 [Streptomyces glaucescens]
MVNYERLDRSLPMLAGWLKSGPSMIILDEAHRMKLGARGRTGRPAWPWVRWPRAG